MKRCIKSNSVQDRITELQDKIYYIEQEIANHKYSSDDELYDLQEYLAELKDELRFAWKEDEDEWLYALNQQEFNPDGSLKLYGKTTVNTYQNKRNPNKYIEEHNDGYGHRSLKQYMKWGDVKNPTGDGNLHRWRKDNVDELLEDYEEVTSATQARAVVAKAIKAGTVEDDIVYYLNQLAEKGAISKAEADDLKKYFQKKINSSKQVTASLSYDVETMDDIKGELSKAVADDVSYADVHRYLDKLLYDHIIDIGERGTLMKYHDAEWMAAHSSADSADNNYTPLTNKELIKMLDDAGIDTTKCKYELRAESYERYGSGRKYTRKFTCPGDWLAYFSMILHKQPTAEAIDDYFEDDFKEYIQDYPTVDAIAGHASSHWWGDGDDYIIYLKNLTTGQILYSADGYEEESEDDEWED